MGSDSRENMVRSAAALIGARGASATSFADVIADSGAPRGSIYHHFPQGKQELVRQAVTWTSDQIVDYLSTCLARTPPGVLDHFIALWEQVVGAGEGAAGCPVVGVLVDAYAGDADILALVRSSFHSWSEILADQLAASGLPSDQARSIAVTSLAAMEGALLLCRAERGDGPLRVVAEQLRRLLPGPAGQDPG